MNPPDFHELLAFRLLSLCGNNPSDPGDPLETTAGRLDQPSTPNPDGFDGNSTTTIVSVETALRLHTPPVRADRSGAIQRQSAWRRFWILLLAQIKAGLEPDC
jgi:hypothetical protein